MDLNFEEIFKSLTAFTPVKTGVKVTREELLRRANEMGRYGYKHTPVTLRALEKYLLGYGILFTGKVGVGKTYFFKCLSWTQKAQIAILSMHECFLWKFDTLDEWLRDNQYSEVLVDDIGSNGKSNSFGTKYEALKYILEARFKSPCRTHFTTNGTPQDLEQVYDQQVVDRLFEYALTFEFDRTESLREAKPNCKDLRNMQSEREERERAELLRRERGEV